MQFDVAIIGAGPSGLFSAFQAGMLGMKSAVIDALEAPGGQCSALYPEKPIYDIPAYPQIMAQDLVERLLQQAEPFAPEYLLNQQVVSVAQVDSGFNLQTSVGNNLTAKAIIIAAGAGSFGPNRPPLTNIEAFEGRSIFYMVTNREKFRGKNIVIAGGGDSAVDWALSLAEIANVAIVHRRDKFRAAPASVEKLHQLSTEGKLNIVTNYQLGRITGDVAEGVLQEVIVADLDGNEKSLKADILLPFFGLAQDLGPILNFGLNIDQHHIAVNYPYFETNIPGIYAVGDVATYSGKLKLILTSFAESAAALHHAYSRVFDGKALHFEYSTTKGIKSA